MSGCALIGGETAEMPDFYTDGEYDIAGFCCGIAKKNKIINGSSIALGDTLIGLASSGIHSNGYSLVRKLFPPIKEELEKFDENLGATPAEVLLTPTRIYVKIILSLIDKFDIKGIAHITGGGFIENIPRIIPKGFGAEVFVNSYPLPNVFTEMQKRAEISYEKMCNTFNMGIGMVLCVSPKNASAVVDYLNANGEKAYIIGKVTSTEGVTFNKDKKC